MRSTARSQDQNKHIKQKQHNKFGTNSYPKCTNSAQICKSNKFITDLYPQQPNSPTQTYSFQTHQYLKPNLLQIHDYLEQTRHPKKTQISLHTKPHDNQHDQGKAGLPWTTLAVLLLVNCMISFHSEDSITPVALEWPLITSAVLASANVLFQSSCILERPFPTTRAHQFILH